MAAHSRTDPFQIAYILYDGLTMLDFIGFYDPISRLRSMGYLPALVWDTCAFHSIVRDHFELSLHPDQVRNDLSVYDMIYVPGGFGTRKLLQDTAFLSWLAGASQVPWKVSVCTGSLLLGAAGMLQGKKATTHFDEYDQLKPYCSEVLRDRLVQDGQTITGGAVASALDLGLYICERLAGAEAREAIQSRMAYPV